MLVATDYYDARVGSGLLDDYRQKGAKENPDIPGAPLQVVDT